MKSFRIGLGEARAISSERRFQILLLIRDGLETHRALAKRLDIAKPSLSRQIEVLRRTGLVSVSRERNSNLKVQNRYTLTERGEVLLSHIDLRSIDKPPLSELAVLRAVSES